MKRFMISILAISVLFAGTIGITNTYAEPGIRVGVVLKDAAGNIKDSFVMGENIIVIMSLDNIPEPGEPEVDVWTSYGFSSKKFHLFLHFLTDFDKELITAIKQTGVDAPPPLSIPIIVEGKPVVLQAEKVERVEAGWAITVNPFNAYDFYNLTKPGRYTVKAVIPLRTYPADKIQTFPGKKIAELVDKDFEGFIVSKTVPFTIEAIRGDLDKDGDIDTDDRAILINALRKCTGDEGFNSDADFDSDGCITFLDYREWFTSYRSFLNP